MQVTDTVIKWNVVNNRVAEKNLPNEHERIVYFNQFGVRSGSVAKFKDKLHVYTFNHKYPIKTGFLWCYQKDIPNPMEV